MKYNYLQLIKLKSSFFFIILFLTNNVSAQLLSANDTADFSNWTAIDADGDNNCWNITDLTGVGTALDAQGGCVISSSWSPSSGILYPDNYLISPAIDLNSNLGNVTLNFKVGSIEPSTSTWFGEWISVYVVTDSSMSYMANCTPIHSDSLTAGQIMHDYSYDISSYCGNSNVYIVFRHHNCHDNNFIILDDIEVSNQITSISQNDLFFNLYPNPCADILCINTNQIIEKIWIHDMQGKLVFEESNPTSNKINIQSFTQGNYTIRVQLENGAFKHQIFGKINQ